MIGDNSRMKWAQKEARYVAKTQKDGLSAKQNNYKNVGIKREACPWLST
jgi:hypothetical protein